MRAPRVYPRLWLRMESGVREVGMAEVKCQGLELVAEEVRETGIEIRRWR